MGEALDDTPLTGLGLTRQQVADTGPFGILRQAFKQLKRSPLPWVLLLVDFPCTLLGVGLPILQSWFLVPRIPSPDVPPTQGSQSQIILVASALGLGNFCLSLLVVGATFFAVGRLYRGKKVTLEEALRAMLGLWPKLFVTGLYYVVFILASTFVILVLVMIVNSIASASTFAIFFILICVVFIILIFALQSLVMLANGVTCYEETYGWAAYKQAKELLQRKWRSALVFALILYVPPTIMSTLVSYSWKITPSSCLWRELVKIVLYAVFVSCLNQLVLVSFALFYFSCSEKSDEQNVSDRMEGGYHSVRTEQV
ncbi:hypothetical protein Mapa_014567 [Marchantia paleacea]|nr:hypothetical protein Mapa_014567 [Marchantia paleacea]